MPCKVTRFSVVSTASTAEHPGNTVSHFTNVLPDVLTLCPSKKYCIKVHSVFLGRQLKHSVPSNYKIDEARVHLAQLRPSYTSAATSLTRCVARFPFGKKTKRPRAASLFHAFANPVSVPFEADGSALYELTFTITDQLNRPLPLSVWAQPTIINLSLEVMDAQDTFSVTVSSLDSKGTFPSNQPWQFHVNFASTFDLGPGWEVALHHVAVPRRIHMEDRMEIYVDGVHVKGANDYPNWAALFEFVRNYLSYSLMTLVHEGPHLRLTPSSRFPAQSLRSEDVV